MRKKKDLGAKHNLWLSNQVWGELKLRAVQENATASELVAFILERFFNDPPLQMNLPRYQPRSGEGGARSGRTVYLPDPLWQRVEEVAQQGGFSVTMLLDVLIKDYLGLAPLEHAESPMADQGKANARRYLKVGNQMIDLGENPLMLDLKSGRLTRRE